MRYPPDHREKTRQRILDAASVVFRAQGFQGASVDDVMAEAGLTAGGFYAHFRSKDELFAETFLRTLQQGRVLQGKEDEHLSGAARLLAIVRKYLSTAHGRLIDQGCPMPPLLADLPRGPARSRRDFQQFLGQVLDSLTVLVEGRGPQESEQAATAIVAMLVGGISLARAVDDPAAAERILSACRTQIEHIVTPPTAGRPRETGKTPAVKPRSRRSTP